MAEPTIAQRLHDLREQLAQLEWQAAAPGAETIDLIAVARLTRELDRLGGYQRLGYKYEPEF